MREPIRALEGLRVLDLSRYLPGPLLTLMLAEMGAVVTKVEPPGGEGLKHMAPRIDGVGAVWRALQAGKTVVELDLRSPEGVAAVEARIVESDVIVEGFRPGVLDRLGLGWSRIQALQPRAILCSISGFGQSGPRALRAGHDLNYLAASGVLGTFGPADGPPGIPGAQIADVAGGTLPAAIAVLAALLERQRTGVGRHLDVSMTDEVRRLAFYGIAGARAGYEERRGEGVIAGGSPCCRCYATADGRYVAFAPLEPHFYDLFCRLVDRPDLQGTGYATGAEGQRVMRELEAVFASRALADWEALAEGHDVCLEAVRTLGEVAAEG